MRKFWSCLLIALLALALLCGGCTRHSRHADNTLGREDLTAGLLPNPPAGGQPAPTPEPKPAELEGATKAETAIADLAVRMLQQAMPAPTAEAKEPENVLLSPVSLVYALGMTANGAAEDTLAQLEKALGLNCAELNAYLKGMLAAGAEDEVLHLANSIWFKADSAFDIKQPFLQVNKDCYDAQLYSVPFNASTLKQINDWVKQNTKGMIPQILQEIPADAVMYLINAVAFEAKWENPFKPQQIRDGFFTTADGQERKVQMMYGTERAYLEDEQACGFIKYYEGRKYAFVGLLPNEDVPLADYVAGLSGDKLLALLANQRAVKVETAIPEFSCDYSLQMNAMLQAFGVRDAFDSELADFSGIGNYDGYPLYISQVLQKCHIEVDAQGTKAAAVTVVEVNATSSYVPPEEVKYVYLDRPFVYLLLDCERGNLPLFVGVVADIKE